MRACPWQVARIDVEKRKLAQAKAALPTPAAWADVPKDALFGAFLQGMRLIGHYQPCMTEIYLHILMRACMADYFRAHPYVSSKGRLSDRMATRSVQTSCLILSHQKLFHDFMHMRAQPIYIYIWIVDLNLYNTHAACYYVAGKTESNRRRSFGAPELMAAIASESDILPTGNQYGARLHHRNHARYPCR
eukprot:COSAG05_NODE_1298_length_5245_cov_2.350107_4_plen_190_part_00